MKTEGSVKVSLEVAKAIKFESERERALFELLLGLCSDSSSLIMRRLTLEGMDFCDANKILTYIYGGIAAASYEITNKDKTKVNKNSEKKGK